MTSTTLQLAFLIERRLLLNFHKSKTNTRFKTSHSIVTESSIKKDLDDIIGFKTTKNSSWIVEVNFSFFK